MANSRSFSKPKRDFNDPVSPPARSPAFIQAPPTNNVTLNLPLDVVLPGADAKIAQAQAMVFHAVGDTGGVKGTETQEGLAAWRGRSTIAGQTISPPRSRYSSIIWETSSISME